jgi:hypothetical protein
MVLAGLAGIRGVDTTSPPAGMGILGTSQPNVRGDVGMNCDVTPQATAAITLSPSAVDWGTVAVEFG